MAFDFGLAGKFAIITGASSGIGEQMAHALAAEGVHVVCVARRAEKLADLVADIQKNGGEASSVFADISSNEQLDRLFDEVASTHGTVDILINNAGSSGQPIPFWEMESAHWEEILRLNLTAVFEASKRFAMQAIAAKKPGVIVNTSSIASFRVPACYAQYAASKAGATQLTRAMAVDLAPHNIRVNSIAPGIFESEMMPGDVLASEVGQQMLNQVPLNRPARTDELDGLILLLVSDKSSYMTGTEIVVDGGWSTRLPGN